MRRLSGQWVVGTENRTSLGFWTDHLSLIKKSLKEQEKRKEHTRGVNSNSMEQTGFKELELIN